MGERENDDHVDVPDLLERVVLPVVRALVHDEEKVEGISLGREHRPMAPGRPELLLTLVVENEEFRWCAVLEGAPPETETHARSRLASDLQDFIAESRFAWGQFRRHPF